MVRGSAQDTASEVHSCAVPVSDEQLWEMAARFVADGLASGERVVYFDDEGAAAAVLSRLADDRVPVRRPLAEGQLSIVPAEVTREALSSSTDRVRGLVTATVDESLAAGWAGLRLT
ncbi:MAG TPA: MEDS domain-containing protein, partial [Pseudonocardia sp.]|nr:MEDS domain-containing protein [Pseudonocardia sp.]